MQGYTRISKPKTIFSRDSPMQNEDAIGGKYGEGADALIDKYVRVIEPIMDKVQAETERLQSLSRKFHQRTQNAFVIARSFGEWRLFVHVWTPRRARDSVTRPHNMNKESSRNASGKRTRNV